MPAALRALEGRPSAPTTRRAPKRRPSAAPITADSPEKSKDLTLASTRARFGEDPSGLAGISASRAFAMFQPNASRLISRAWNSTGRAANREPVSSTMRSERNGETEFSTSSQTPKSARKSTDRPSSATVRPGASRSIAPDEITEKPDRAKPIAAAAPARPAPTTKTSQFSAVGGEKSAIALIWHACFLAVQTITRPRGARRSGGPCESPRTERGSRADFRGNGAGGGECPPAGVRGRGRRDGTRGKTAARASRGGVLRSPLHGVGRSGRPAPPPFGARARPSSLFRLARRRSLHRRDRRHAGALRPRVRIRRDDRRRRPGSRRRFPDVCARARRRALAVRSDARCGVVLAGTARLFRARPLFRGHADEDQRLLVSRF